MEIDRRFIVFLFVGGINTVFGYGIFAVGLLVLKLDYPFALLISTIAGILFNFKTIGLIVFKNSNNKLIYRFVSVYIVCYLVNLLLLYLLKLIIDHSLYAQAILALPVALLAFTLNKKFVFVSHKP